MTVRTVSHIVPLGLSRQPDSGLSTSGIAGCTATWSIRTLAAGDRVEGKNSQGRRDLNNWRVYTEEDLAVLKELMVPTSEN